VAGIGLLASLGPEGLLGPVVGDSLALQTAGVVVALTFVAAPFYVRQAQAAFESVDPRQIDASRTLGAGEARTFARVAVPAARPGLAAGLALAWGRALGEFGATLMFASSIQGETQTAPLAIYDLFGTDFTAALALSAVLVCVSAALLLTVKLAGGAGPATLASR
jgi:molybdate transport system permease protein